MEWIRSSERLPKDGERVLMCIDETGVFEGYYSSQKNGWFRNETPVFIVFEGFVTHWMPLPCPPDEGI